MPQCDFFNVDADEARLVEWIVSNDGWLVPDLEYDQPSYDVAKNLREYLDHKRSTTLFFVLHPSFYRCPLEIRPYSSGPKVGRYFLMQRNGGPAISLFVPREYENDGVRYVPPRMVAYYPTFFNLNTRENEEAPTGLVVFFRNLVRQVREGALERSVVSRTYWVSRAAMEEFRKGALRPGLDIEL